MKAASLALAALLVAGCAGSGVMSHRPGTNPATRTSIAATSSEGDLQRPRIDVTNWEDQRTLIPLHLFVPEAARNIGPGSAIVITIPGEGRFGCTANFVWEARGRRFLGSAGHCFLPAAASATHGPGADYDASGVVVEVCVEACEGNFRSNLLLGTWVRLGKVAYARQQNLEGSGVGHDFGVVEIPREFRDYVRAEMPVWRGPNGVQELHLGDYGCHYGHGLVVGETFLTKARVGIGGGSDPDAWSGDFAGAFGDSGSPMVGCVNDGLGFHGTGAVGVITHLGIRLSTSGEHGVIFGTTVRRAVEMAREANLRLSLVLP
ncbi:MAG: hypothetical protein QN163_00780 [Armatimonadota bacterium]|nr:hypothetical protein [Armatimonadota bacterium]MDR5697390.1 hypothetical protein [Armatimonadota bacterium]